MPDDRPLTKQDLADALGEFGRKIDLRFDDLDRKIDGVRIELLERMGTLSHNMNQRFDDLENRRSGGPSKLPRAARRS